MQPNIFLVCLTHSRENCKVDISGKHVVKRYTCRYGEARVKGLETHYHLLWAKRVPNVDQLLHAFDNTVVLTRTPENPERSLIRFGQFLYGPLSAILIWTSPQASRPVNFYMDKGSGLSEPEFSVFSPHFVVLGHAELNFELERARRGLEIHGKIHYLSSNQRIEYPRRPECLGVKISMFLSLV